MPESPYRGGSVPRERAAEVLAKADALAKRRGAPRPGAIPIEELEDIATRLGIDASDVRAVVEEGEPVRVPSSWWLGAPLKFSLERPLGRVATEADLERLVEAMRRATGDVGRVERIGASATWMGNPGAGRRVMLTVTTRGASIARVEESFVPLVALLLLGVPLVLLVASLLLPETHTPPAIAVTLAAVATVAVTILRAMYASIVRRRCAELATALSSAARPDEAAHLRVATEKSAEDAEIPADDALDDEARERDHRD